MGADHTGLTIDGLERWAGSGGRWRVVELSHGHVVVDLCAPNGDAVERVESDDPGVVGCLRTVPAWKPVAAAMAQNGR
ncbi:MAG: hypothetical protein ACRDL8_18525 [Solirubrobacteraceae bacterium]